MAKPAMALRFISVCGNGGYFERTFIPEVCINGLYSMTNPAVFEVERSSGTSFASDWKQRFLPAAAYFSEAVPVDFAAFLVAE